MVLAATLLRQSHLPSERIVRPPLATGDGRGLFEHLVDLFEREPFRFRDEEVGEQEAEEQRPAPDEEDLHAQVPFVLVHDVGGDDRDHAVPQPVRRRRQRDPLGPDREWEQFADHDPGRRTPGRGESGNVETGEDNETDITVYLVVSPCQQKKKKLGPIYTLHANCYSRLQRSPQ